MKKIVNKSSLSRRWFNSKIQLIFFLLITCIFLSLIIFNTTTATGQTPPPSTQPGPPTGSPVPPHTPTVITPAPTPPAPSPTPKQTPIAASAPISGSTVPTYTKVSQPSTAPGIQSANDKTYNGLFSIVWTNSSEPNPPRIYYLFTGEKQPFQLDLEEALANPLGGIFALSGKQVVITGAVNDGTLKVSSIQLIAQAGTNAIGGPTNVVTGTVSFINVLCKFSDKASTEPKLASYFDANHLMSNSYPGLNNYFKETSYNNLNINNSTTTNWVTLPHPQSYYISNFTAFQVPIANDCLQAVGPSVNFNNYQGINFMFNSDLGPNVTYGRATSSATITAPSGTKKFRVTWQPYLSTGYKGWGSQANVARLMSQSLGLVLLLGVGGTINNLAFNPWDVVNTSLESCSVIDTTYGCVAQHPATFNKSFVGWLRDNQVFISTGGTNTVLIQRSAQPQNNSGAIMVQIPIGNSNTRFYTVEVRKPISYDQKIPTEGVIIHKVDTSLSEPGVLISSNGTSAGAIFNETNNTTFNDNANHITIQVVGKGSDYYQVTITNPIASTNLQLNAAPVNDNLATYGDAKWYRVSISSYGRYMFKTQLSSPCDNNNTLCDSYLYLYGPNNYEVARDDDNGGNLTSRITLNLEAGVYYLKVTGFSPTQFGTFSVKWASVNIASPTNYSVAYLDAFNRYGNGYDYYGEPLDQVQQYDNTGVYWQPFNFPPYLWNGTILFHDQAGGATPGDIRAYQIASYNLIGANYLNIGGPSSYWGKPTSDLFYNASSQLQQNFANGYAIINENGDNDTVSFYNWPSPPFNAWKASYFNNAKLYSAPTYIADEGNAGDLNLNYSWPGYAAPLPQQGLTFAESWSARWERNFTFNTTANYLFTLCGDDGVRLYLNGQMVIDDWRRQGNACSYYTIPYNAGTNIPLKIEYYQYDGATSMSFSVTTIPPYYATNLTATYMGGTTIDLSWNYSAPAYGYFSISRKTSASDEWKYVNSFNYNSPQSQFTFTDPDAAPGRTNYYRIYSEYYDGSNWYYYYSNPASASVSSINLTNLPQIPVDGQTVEGNISTSGQGSWYKLVIPSYEQYSLDTYEGTMAFPILAIYGPDTLSFVGKSYFYDSDLVSNIALTLNPGVYYVKVREYYSSYTGTFKVKAYSGHRPYGPYNLNFSGITNNSITFSWTDNSVDESGFVIQRSKTGDYHSFVAVGQVGPNVTTFTDRGLPLNTQFYYRVRSFNSLGTSVDYGSNSAFTGNQADYTVSNPFEYGNDASDTLLYALRRATSGQTINFSLTSGSTIYIKTTANLDLQPGVTISGICNSSGPGIIIDGSDASAGAVGLKLRSNDNLYGIWLRAFRQNPLDLNTFGARGTKMSCVKSTKY